MSEKDVKSMTPAELKARVSRALDHAASVTGTPSVIVPKKTVIVAEPVQVPTAAAAKSVESPSAKPVWPDADLPPGY
jgi:hypothetical protein